MGGLKLSRAVSSIGESVKREHELGDRGIAIIGAFAR
jgi:hypothetical protein